MLKYSLTLRLTLFFTVAILLLLSGLSFFVSSAIDAHFIEQDNHTLEEKKVSFKNAYQQNADLASLFLIAKNHSGLIFLVKGVSEAFPKEEKEELFKWQDKGNRYLGLPFLLKEGSAPVLHVVLAININHHQQFLDVFHAILLKFILFTGGIGGCLAWFLTRKGLQPLVKLSEQASLISLQDLTQRMPEKGLPIEILSLSKTLNKMLQRLEEAVGQLSHFSSDIAHELRSPVNNLMTQTQVSLSKPRSKEQYVDLLASNVEEFEQLSRMITDMLFLAKSDNQAFQLDKKKLALHEELLQLIEFYDALAEDNQLQITVQGEAYFTGEQLMIRRAFSNLLSNAIRHSYSGSCIEISLITEADNITIEVKNRGEIISPTDLPYLFDRFYRVDKSRSHSKHSGVGLGLAITRSIIEAHAGTLSVTSFNEETVFCIKFSLI